MVSPREKTSHSERSSLMAATNADDGTSGTV
jgi:hypothetical protein